MSSPAVAAPIPHLDSPVLARLGAMRGELWVNYLRASGRDADIYKEWHDTVTAAIFAITDPMEGR